MNHLNLLFYWNILLATHNKIYSSKIFTKISIILLIKSEICLQFANFKYFDYFCTFVSQINWNVTISFQFIQVKHLSQHIDYQPQALIFFAKQKKNNLNEKKKINNYWLVSSHCILSTLLWWKLFVFFF